MARRSILLASLQKVRDRFVYTVSSGVLGTDPMKVLSPDPARVLFGFADHGGQGFSIGIDVEVNIKAFAFLTNTIRDRYFTIDEWKSLVMGEIWIWNGGAGTNFTVTTVTFTGG